MANFYNQQAKDDIYNPIDNSGIVNASNNSFNSIQNFINKNNEHIQSKINNDIEQARQLFTIQAESNIINSSKSLFETYNSDPINLEKELQKNLEKIIAKIPDEKVKINTYKQYYTMQPSLIQQAKTNYAVNQDNEQKISTFNNIESKIEILDSYYFNMFNNNVDINSQADYNINLQEVNNLLQLKNHKGNNSFNNTDINKINDRQKEIKLNSGYKFFNTLFENDEVDFKNSYIEWKNNPQTIQDKYNIDENEYNKILKNAKSLYDEYEKNPYNNKTQILKNTQVLTDLKTKLDIFNINGKDNIENEKFNNVESIVAFRNQIREARANNSINNQDYINFMSQTGAPLYNIIGEKKIKNKSNWSFNNTAIEHIDKKINKYFNNIKDLELEDKLFFYENTYNIATENGINLNATDSKTKDKINNIMEHLQRQYINNKFEPLKENTNAVIFGNNIIGYDRKAGQVGNNTINNGGYVRMKDKNGNEAYVLKDKQGKVIDIKKIK